MPNPILDSQLYKDTGSIEKGIKDLGLLSEAYDKLLKQVKSDSVKLSVSVGKLNTANAAHREELKKSAKSADELSKANEKYNKSLDANAIKIEELKLQQRNLNTFNRATAKLNKSLATSYNRLSAQYTLNKLKLNAMTKAEREATKSGKELVRQTESIFKEMKRLQEVTGKHTLSVGDYGKAIRGLGGPFSGWLDNISSAVGGFRSMQKGLKGAIGGIGKFKIALASTGIGLIVIALGALFAALTKTQEGLDFVSRISSSLNAVFSVVIDRAAALGSAIINLFKGKFTAAAADAKRAFSGIGAEIAKEAKEAAILTGELQKLREEKRDLAVQTDQTRAEIKRLSLITEDVTKGTKERIEAGKEAIKIESALLAERERITTRELEIIKAQVAQSNSLAEDRDKIADKERELAQIQIQSIELITTLNNKLNVVRQQAKNAEIKRQAEIQAALKKQREAVLEITKFVEETDVRLSGSGFKAQAAYQKAIDKIEEMEERAKKLGLSLDFDNLKAKELLAFNAALGKLRPAVTDFVKSGSVSVLQNQIKAVNEEVRKIGTENSKIPEKLSILDQLGIGPSQLEGIKTTFATFKNLFKELSAERVKAAAEAVKASDREISAAEGSLQAQLKRNELSLSSNIQRAEDELAQAQSTQRKALAEQRKAQRQQRGLQTIQQTGNLLTASSKIWGQLGFPFAIPAIAVMWGSFIASKAKAASLTRDQRRSGSFEVLNYGGSHQSKNDIDLGVTGEGKQRVVESGEGLAVINKAAIRKYQSILPGLINAINTGSLASVLENRHASSGVNIYSNDTNTAIMEKELSAIRKQGEERYISDKVYIRGNVKTYYN